MVTIDLENLQGWNDLPDGTYDITVGAKAEGYTRIIQSQAVSVTKGTPQEYFLTFSSVNGSQFSMVMNTTQDFVTYTPGISWDGTVEYSTDKENWSAWDGTSVSSSVNGKIYFRGIGNTYFTDVINEIIGNFFFDITDDTISIEGNIENLLDYQTVANGQHPTMADYCYFGMFAYCSSLTTAPELPATNLTERCYQNMFAGCTSLTTAPQLPATTLVEGCYQSMFDGCTSLTTAPELPATTLAYQCYLYMFAYCTSLTTAPELPATTLVDYTYDYMFYNCTSLYVSDTQTVEAQYEWRIPTNAVITGTDNYEQFDMFTGCLGTRASDDLAGEVGQQYIYYTQNEPVGSN